MRLAHPQSPISPKTPDTRRAWLCRAFAVALAGAFFPLGCVHRPSSPPTIAEPELARVRIQNFSDRAWRVALDPAEGPAGEIWEIAPRGEHVARLAAGDYRLRCSLAEEVNDDEATAGEPVRLAAGGDYTWPLAMLLADPEEGAAR